MVGIQAFPIGETYFQVRAVSFREPSDTFQSRRILAPAVPWNSCAKMQMRSRFGFETAVRLWWRFEVNSKGVVLVTIFSKLVYLHLFMGRIQPSYIGVIIQLLSTMDILVLLFFYLYHCICIARWWQLRYFFIFTPIWRRFPIWQAYFSDGLKPPN